MITCYDDKLRLVAEMALVTENWPVGCLLEYAGQYLDNPDELFDYNVDELRELVYDRFCDELMEHDDEFLTDLSKSFKRG